MSEYEGSIETETSQLIQKIRHALEASRTHGNPDDETKNRQNEILKNLPPDFAISQKAFAAMVENHSDHPLRREMFGEIFEELVRADQQICPKGETREAEQVRSILRQPEMYGLQEYGLDSRHMNPDVARIDEEGRIVGAVEVKSGRIDYRGYKQIGQFEENIAEVVHKLEGIPTETLKEHGLGKIAEKLDRLQISPDFKLVLAVPNGVYSGDARSLLMEEDFFDEDKRQKAAKRIGNCEIVQSPFSRRDIAIVTDCVMDWVQKPSGKHKVNT